MSASVRARASSRPDPTEPATVSAANFAFPAYATAACLATAVLQAAWMFTWPDSAPDPSTVFILPRTGNASAASAMPSIRPPRISTRASGAKPEQGDMHRYHTDSRMPLDKRILGDLISYQNDRKCSTAIVGKPEIA
jgi:hypothetical protein